MIKNIPMRYSQQDLLRIIQERHKDTFDYFYLPMDLKVSACVENATILSLQSLKLLRTILNFCRLCVIEVMLT